MTGKQPVELGKWWICHRRTCVIRGERRWEGLHGTLRAHNLENHTRRNGTTEPGRRPDEIPGWTDWPFQGSKPPPGR